MGTFYISTPIYYVNDLPHIGHIYTTVVADVMARYKRFVGEDVFFVTGTDEHGQSIMKAAAKLGIEPREQADRVVSRYHELWKTLEITNDEFIRTTEDRHRVAVEAIVARMEASGDFYTALHEGWYCASCESFYTEKELIAGGRCPVHESKPEWQSEENVFFKLSKYQEPLLELYSGESPFVIPKSRANEVRAFVEGGLKDISVSRAALDWGIPFPGRENEVIYVWLDALTNYLSALGFGSEDSERMDRYWNSEGGTRINLIGKDILRFHAIWWPAFLMSAGLPVPTTVAIHGWWLRDDKKMSKSVGNVVRPDHLIERFGPDVLRYFLLRDMIFGQDASFSDEAFVDRYNSDLANDLGNTVSRLVKLSRSTFDGKTPPEACGNNPLIAAAEKAVAEYHEAMDQFAFSRALRSLWALLSEVNQYLVTREPWKVVKTEGASPAVSRVLWNGLEAVRIVTTALSPVMPGTAARILETMGASDAEITKDALEWGRTPLDVELADPEAIFPRADKKKFLSGEEEPPPKPAPKPEKKEESDLITIDEFFKTQLKVATIQAAERIEGTDKLIKLEVDIGEEENRTLVAGIAEVYPVEELIGRQVAVVANLKPAKLRGVESQGMILAASVDGKPMLLSPDEKVPNGTPVK
jgi:methionyl-tRNA synthetase